MMNLSSELQQRHQAVLAMPMAQTLQLAFRRIEAGAVELEMPVLDAFCFRPGQLQATAVFAAADFAAVAAAATLLGTARNIAPRPGSDAAA